MKKCYYETLGVERDCDIEVIKKTYRKLALQYHPDRNPDDTEAEERFKECAEAYEVLRDPEKRRLYDMYGHDGLKRSGFSGFGGVEDIFSTFGDIFGDLFGFGGQARGRGATGPQPGRDMRYDLEITLEQAAQGFETSVKAGREVNCKTCNGTGSADDAGPSVCAHCGGSGQVIRAQGFFRLATTCPVCRGEGRVITDPCPDCGGRGRAFQERELSVKVPAGIDHGQRLRMRGEGEGGFRGGGPGDLYVVVHVAPHAVFEREGDNLYRRLEVSMFQAALGHTVMVDTLVDDEAELPLPAGVQTGQALKLAGLGMPSLRGGRRGDLLVQVVVKTPSKLSKRQKELLEEAAALGDREAASLPPAEGEAALGGEKKKKRRWGFN
ncbi:MAG: molecular chaperone DnaJ [Deltaproteobacteria bacterium]|nr:molecular chaperone DnaJ [Deltaproteobacteria bacterium]